MVGGKPHRRWGAICWRVIRAVIAFVVALLVIGGKILDLTERPEQIERIERWYGVAMSDPRVYAMAVWTANAIDFLNRWWVRAILIILALVLIFWGARPFWRFRHRALFR